MRGSCNNENRRNMQETAHAVPNAVVHAGWRHRVGHWVGLGITTFEKRRLSGALFMTD